MTLNKWHPDAPISRQQQTCLGERIVILECLYGYVTLSARLRGPAAWFPSHPCEHDARYA